MRHRLRQTDFCCRRVFARSPARQRCGRFVIGSSPSNAHGSSLRMRLVRACGARFSPVSGGCPSIPSPRRLCRCRCSCPIWGDNDTPGLSFLKLNLSSFSCYVWRSSSLLFFLAQAAENQFGGTAETRLQYLMQQSEVFTHFLDRYVCTIGVYDYVLRSTYVGGAEIRRSVPCVRACCLHYIVLCRTHLRQMVSRTSPQHPRRQRVLQSSRESSGVLYFRVCLLFSTAHDWFRVRRMLYIVVLDVA